MAVALSFSLFAVALWVPLRAQGFEIPVASETVTRGSSDGFQNQRSADSIVNVKSEAGTPLTSSVTLLPNADGAGGWGEPPCDTDATFFDELDEDPADDDATCRLEVRSTAGDTVMATLMADLTPPPGLVDDYDVTATGRVRLASGDDAGPTVSLASSVGACGGLLGGTQSAAYVDVTMSFERCSGASEWTESDLDGLIVESRCPAATGIPEECRATQHKAIVDIAYRTDFSLDFTSRFEPVFGVALTVQWDCTTNDDEGLDLHVDGVLVANGVCSGASAGSVTIPDVPSPRPVDVRLVSPTPAGDGTESTYVFDVFRIQGNPNAAPSANAGPDQDVLRGVVVQLDGRASSDPNGHALTFSWTQAGGPSVTLVGGTTSTPSFTPGPPGSFAFELTVTDGFSGSDADVVVVAVTNREPTADAGSDGAVPRNLPALLNGSRSADADNDPLSFQWTQVSGPFAALSGANASIATFIPSPPGTYTFQLSVDDGFAGRAEDFVVLTAPNIAPASDAGADQVVSRNVLVILNGGSSSDADADPLTFEWTQASGPTVPLSGSNTSTATFTPAAPGGYAFELAVSDGFGGVDADVVVVTTTNGEPIAFAGPDQTVPTGILAILDGRTSSDPESDPLSFGWAQVSGPLATLSGANASIATFTPSSPGTYTFRLSVDDGFDGRAEDFVVATATNGVPIANAGFDQVAPKHAPVTLDGRNSLDPDLDVLTFRWTQLSGPPVALAGGTTPMPSFTPTRSGVYTFGLEVDDGLGGQAVDFVVVTVLNRAPVALAGPNRSGPKNEVLSLDATASSDPDGDGLSYVWTQTAGPTIVLSNPTSAMPSFLPPSVGSYAFLLLVDDGDGGVATDTVLASIWGRAPVAVLTLSTNTTAVHAPITFGAGASTDPDGAIGEYLFDFGDGGVARGTSPSAVHAYEAVGVFPISLTVTDDDGNSTTVEASVTILGNAAPLADARVWTPSIGYIGTPFGFAAGNSTDDVGIARYDWDFGDGTEGTGATIFHAFAAKGSFTVSLTVTDVAGLTDASTVVVTVGNRSPRIETQTPAESPVTIVMGQTMTFAIDARDPDGDALMFGWRVDGLAVGSNAAIYGFPGVRTGTFLVTLTVSDGSDEAVREWTVHVTASPPTLQPGSAADFLPEILLLAVIAALAVLLLRRRRGRPSEAPPEPTRDETKPESPSPVAKEADPPRDLDELASGEFDEEASDLEL